jgi:hypothetical protein
LVLRASRTAKKLQHEAWLAFGTIGNEIGEGDELLRQDLSLIFKIMKNKLMALFIRFIREKQSLESQRMRRKISWLIFFALLPCKEPC